MTHRLLVVGYLHDYVQELVRCAPGIEITAIEEPTLRPTTVVPGVKIVEGRYQQSDEAVHAVQRLNETFDGVIPLREYAVPIANDIASLLELPRVGRLASRCFRDKFLLRTTLAGKSLSHIKQPQFARVCSKHDLRAFFEEHGPCVIKPSNKQATVGVFKIWRPEAIAASYDASTAAAEPGRLATDRRLVWSHHVETLIPGQEYSSEVFVDEGLIRFCNVTKKRTSDGDCPYEIGHVLPVSLFDERTHERISHASVELVQTLGVETAVLHAEWMVNDEGVYLIECAARPPGDHITALISNSYRVGFFSMYLSVMTRRMWPLVADPSVLSAIRLFNPLDGVVSAVQVSPPISLDEKVKVIKYTVSTEPGACVALANNQTRVGYVIGESRSLQALECSLERIAAEAVITHPRD